MTVKKVRKPRAKKEKPPKPPKVPKVRKSPLPKHYELRTNDKSSGKYKCEPCGKSFRDSFDLKEHLKTMKHNPSRYVNYECEMCMYSTRIKHSLIQHERTQKHINRIPRYNLMLDIMKIRSE